MKLYTIILTGILSSVFSAQALKFEDSLAQLPSSPFTAENIKAGLNAIAESGIKIMTEGPNSVTRYGTKRERFGLRGTVHDLPNLLSDNWWMCQRLEPRTEVWRGEQLLKQLRELRERVYNRAFDDYNNHFTIFYHNPRIIKGTSFLLYLHLPGTGIIITFPANPKKPLLFTLVDIQCPWGDDNWPYSPGAESVIFAYDCQTGTVTEVLNFYKIRV